MLLVVPIFEFNCFPLSLYKGHFLINEVSEFLVYHCFSSVYISLFSFHQIQQIILHHFHQLFLVSLISEESHEDSEFCPAEIQLLVLITPVITEDQTSSLFLPFTAMEVKLLYFKLDP